MSSETKIQSIAAGLQPKSLDLTQFAPAKRGNTYGYRRDIKVSAQDAAGALAFAASDIEIAGEPQRGDPLPGLLLRLKYARHMSRDTFAQAFRILVHRYGGLAVKDSAVLDAVAQAALFEWVNDACPACRERRARSHKRQGKERGGMRCLACRNSGRKGFDLETRRRLVNERLGGRASGLKMSAFRHWMPRYYGFLDRLRGIDRARLVMGVDLGYRPSLRTEEHIEPLQSVGEPLDAT